MSELGEFLERFYAPAPTFRTVRARVRHLKKSAPQGATGRRERAIGRRRTDMPSEVEREDELVMWGCPPDRVRLEATRTRDGRTETTLQIVNGEDFMPTASWSEAPHDIADLRTATRCPRNINAISTEL